MSDAADALRRATRFVAIHASPLASAWARALAREVPAAEALAALDAADAGDDALCLRICDELRVRSDARVERAALRLADDQAPDGGFLCPPGDLETRLRHTGMCGGYLAKTPFARPELLDAAGDFLAQHFAPERVQAFQWDNLAAYAHFFANANHEAADGVLQWCGRELERGYRGGVFEASRCAWLLACCDAHVVPGARLDPAELFAAAWTEQARDGGFGLPVAPAAERVEATLRALSGIRHLAPVASTARAPRVTP